jgi:ribosome-associated translation inhibitor RaiA
MKLSNVIEECEEIKEYLADMIGNREKIQMNVEISNMKVVYVLPTIEKHEKKKNLAMNLFLEEKGERIIQAKGPNFYESVEKELDRFERELIKLNLKSV